MNTESHNIEWKSAWRDEYLKWIAGFANAQGGTLLIGKNDVGDVIGVEKAEKLLEDIPNKVRDVLGIVVNANTLFRAGLIEAWGRGIEKMFDACQAHGTPTPTLRYMGNGVWIEFAMKNQITSEKTSEKASEKTVGETVVQIVGKKSPKKPPATMEVTMEVKSLLKACHRELSRAELQKKLSIKNNEHFRNNYIKPALECNFIEMTRPDKPNSRLQKYQLTDKGKQLVEDGFKSAKPESSGAPTKKKLEKHGVVIRVPVEVPVETEAPVEAPVETEAPVEAPVETEAPVEAPVETEAPVEAPVELTKTQHKILNILEEETCGRSKILLKLGYSQKPGNFRKALESLIKEELIVMTRPDKPNSRLQKYRLTDKGKRILKDKEQRI